MNRRDRLEREKQERLIKEHELYPDFVKYMKKISTKTLNPRSINNRLNVIIRIDCYISFLPL